MKVLHINAGLEEGGAKTHILSLLSQFPFNSAELLVLEEGLVSKEAREKGIKVNVINQKSRYDLTVLNKLEDFININKFDIVHTHGARANLLLGIIKKKISSTWISTVHSDPILDFMDKGLKGKVFSLLNRYSLKKAVKIITVTEGLKADLIKIGIPSKKIYVVYNGIRFNEEIPVEKSQTVFTLTCIARLHPVKAHDFLFKSLKTSSLINFHLNIIGDGKLRNYLEKRAISLNLQDQIQFHGTLEKIEIEKILQKTDLTVLSSISEGFPLVLLESANQKTPFIATNVGDVAKLVPDPSISWIVPTQDLEAFSLALKEAYALWKLDQLAEKGCKLFKLASNTYSLENMYFNTLSVYSTYISTR